MKFREFLQTNTVLLDGGTGTLLQASGLPLGELPELWNLTHAQTLVDIHKAYFDAGSNVVCTNTFGANALKFSEKELEKIIRAGVENAKKAKELSRGEQEKFVALDIGPLGKLLKPYGDLAFEDAVSLFKKAVKIGAQSGADLILLETFGDSYETKAAVLAVREECDLPLLVSCVYGEDKKLMTGASPMAMTAMLEGLGVDALGANCSLGPNQLAPTVEELLAYSSTPVLVKPNAGLPVFDGKKTVYDITAETFAKQVAEFVKKGARLVGGCCGTTPEYIRALKKEIANIPTAKIAQKNISCVCSYTHAVELNKPILIGERINPTGKKRFKQALVDGELDYALGEAVNQKDKGAHILDVNVGLPDIDEAETLEKYIQAIQSTVDLPLQIDTSNPVALEKAMRVYNGKPLVNSVNGKKESMESVFPLVKKYGGVVVALTLDENGIPQTAQGRLAIAKKIIDKAKEYGIAKKDILVDTLTLSIATDKNAAKTTLEALRLVKDELGVGTVLGVSNVSFGLPARDMINASFFALALENGLVGAIVNPFSAEMQKTYKCYLALKGLDENCEKYIAFASESVESKPALQEKSTLKQAICDGRKDSAAGACQALLGEKTPVQIIDEEIVPALDIVGKAYEEKRAYLPNLLMSAEAAKSAFTVLKEYIAKTGERQAKKCKFVLATVKGDIHDIGKNIVKSLLENYGFEVIDLGKDVDEETIVSAVIKHQAPLVGLSALMTTTVASMEKTVRLLKEKTPFCKICVGGAVLSESYAQKMGADFYGKDAMETVRYAEKIYNNL